MTQWSDEVHTRIAASIKKARGKRSAQWLADRTAELGYPLSRAQIANYESGRKKGLDIAELMVIAAALDTSPTGLVFPGPYDAEVEFVPGRHESQINAAQWFSGLEAPESLVGLILEDEDRPGHGDWDAWDRNTSELHNWRSLRELEVMRNDLLSEDDERLFKRIAFIEDQIRLTRQHLVERSRPPDA